MGEGTQTSGPRLQQRDAETGKPRAGHAELQVRLDSYGVTADDSHTSPASADGPQRVCVGVRGDKKPKTAGGRPTHR